MRLIEGTELHPNDRAHVLSAYVNRFTGDHTPQWAKSLMRNGLRPYPLQFKNDQEWLAHTRFSVRTDGRLDLRVRHCQSSPTWPNGI